MYKNIEVLDKTKHAKIKFDDVAALEVGKNIGLIPLGFTEVWNMSYFAPVVISDTTNGEFLAFTGVTKEVTVFNKNETYTPAFLRTYPFLNIAINDEKGEPNSVIGIDNNSEFVGEKKTDSIITKEKELTEEASKKIELVRELNRQREISKKIINELQSHDLLIQKDLRVKVGEEERVILEKFFVINIEKLTKLDDTTLATWAKKGWMGIFDAHIKSLNNFQKVLQSNS